MIFPIRKKFKKSEANDPVLDQQDIYYFLHIPKTAGTSLSSWLLETNKFRICPDYLLSDLLNRDFNELKNYNLFRGHFYQYLPCYLEKPLKTFTFLRNPYDRAISHYNHILRAPNHYFHHLAKEQGSFLKFLQDPRTQPMIKNFQVRSLSNLLTKSELLESYAKYRSASAPFQLERHLESEDSDYDNGIPLILAKDFLTRSFFVGIVEHMDDSVNLLAEKLKIPNKAIAKVKYLNAGECVKIDRLTTPELNELTKLLELDLELYEFALYQLRNASFRS